MNVNGYVKIKNTIYPTNTNATKFVLQNVHSLINNWEEKHFIDKDGDQLDIVVTSHTSTELRVNVLKNGQLHHYISILLGIFQNKENSENEIRVRVNLEDGKGIRNTVSMSGYENDFSSLLKLHYLFDNIASDHPRIPKVTYFKEYPLDLKVVEEMFGL